MSFLTNTNVAQTGVKKKVECAHHGERTRHLSQNVARSFHDEILYEN